MRIILHNDFAQGRIVAVKRILALMVSLLLVFGFFLIPSHSFAHVELTPEEAEEFGYLYPSPVSIFYELWDVPWGASPEDFLEKARCLYNISFRVLYEDDYLGEFSFESSDDDPIYLFDYPFSIISYFLGDPQGGEGILSEIYINVPANISFSMLSAWLMADDVFHALCTHYGEPLTAYIKPRNCDDVLCSCFALPMSENRLDIPKLIEKGEDGFYVIADFENLSFYFSPGDILAGQYTCLGLKMFAPSQKHMFGNLPPAVIHPFEDYHPVEPTHTPTLAPTNRIDIELW